MLHAIENQLFRKVAPFTIRHIQRPDLATDDPLVRKVMEQASREFQVAPPVTLHQPDPLLLAGVWGLMREAFVVHAEGRVVREAVAAAVSQLNECPYCVDVHASMHLSAGGEGNILTDELSNGTSASALAYQWASATLTPDADIIHHPQIPAGDVPQVFGTAICFHFINRMVNIFLDKAPMPMPAAGSNFMRAFSRASLRFFGKRMVQLDGEPGAFIIDPGEMALPPEFSWSASDLNVAGSLTRFAYAAEHAGREALHEDVRTVVTDHLQTWKGEPPGLGRGWVDTLVKQVDARLQPSTRLALLAARASWQIDEQVVADFRSVVDDDRSLIQAAGWASFAAVRRIAGWL
ncbi:hypothetical protein MNBD_GAMMA13-1514 [hydrothermal vent metagenome]|uniref:Carboxymuconolactone decarboxylase-like domain-containing protein n=1 Tax=hydrothermal vent metagenome TaxID=652676 RepID=A0A3B0Z2T5_9ZZZZ